MPTPCFFPCQAVDLPLLITKHHTIVMAHDDLRAQLVGNSAFKPYIIDLFPDFPLRKGLGKVALVARAEGISQTIINQERESIVQGDASICVTAAEQAKAFANLKAKQRAKPKSRLPVPLYIRTDIAAPGASETESKLE